jgi:hemerythrin-like domain-containing protein
MPQRNVFQELRDDHQRVLDELVVFERAASLVTALRSARGSGSTGTPARRRAEDARATMRRVLDHFAEQFDTHMAAEDDVLFPMLTRALPEALGRIEPLALEHRELRGMLGSLRELIGRPVNAVADEQIAVQSRDFVDLLRIHVRKEEAVVFCVAERLLAPQELEEVASRMVRGTAARPRRVRGNPKGRRS